jgi:glycosidase
MKSKLFLILGICLFAFTSCSEITMEEKSENVKITNYGSVNVYSDRTDNRAIKIDSIKFANVKITGKDIETGFEPFTNGVTLTGGKGSFTVNDVPVGKNRIVTVTGLDSSKSAIYGVQLRNIVDVDAKTNDVVVNWASTALGNVFAVLHDNDVDVSTVDKEKIQNAISSSVHASLIDVNAIATDYKNNSLKAASSYIMQSAGLDLTCDDNGAFKIQVCDPASKVYSGSGTSGSVTGIAPGTWKVMLLDSSDNVIQEEVVVFASGKTSELSFATVKDKIVLHAYDWTHCYAWTGSSNALLGQWPGKAMTKEGTSKWYGITLDVTSVNIVFNNNGNGQTSDLSVKEAGEYWWKNNKWYDYNPDDTESPVVAWNEPSANSLLYGVVTLSVIASDNVGISKIEFYLDGTKLIATAENGATSISWDSANAANGTHTLKAIAYDAVGNHSETASVTIKTQNQNKAPVANAGGDKTGVKGVNITFDGSKSTDNGEIVSYAWDFGDGSTGVGKSATHSYSKAGTYTVKLVVTDEEGLTGSATISVKINEKGSFIHRDFREENVYFMMTDRFADGDKNNNNLWGDEYLPKGESQMYDFNESKTGILTYYHGGDFKGIIDNLDYLVDMGFTAIWITPSVKQAEGRFYYGDYEASAFHGYWGYDFDKIDPHLHSSGKDSDGWADYKAMVDACHAKGIRVMQDVVINHGNQSVSDQKTKWHALDGTVIMDGQTWTWKTKDKYYDGVNLSNGFYAYKDAWGCAGLIDFNDKSPDRKDARQHMINVYKKFIDAGVDAFRIDTVAYVTNEWCGEFADAMYNHAKSLGNDHFYMIGEAWCGRYDAIARHSKDTTDSLHMLDMHLSCLDYPGEMSSVFKDGGDYSRYNNVVASDASWGTDAEEHTWTSMFVDNHDCFRNNGIYSETQYKNALNYIYLFRGVPIVFYGTEAMYSWSGAHASTNKDDVVSRWMLGDQGINYVKQNKPTMYKHLKALNTIRSASPCIQKGVQKNIELKGDKAVFTRTHEGKTAYVAISKGAAYSQKFDNVQSGTYTEYSSSSNGSYTAKEISVSGSYTASVPANGFTYIEPK